MRHEIVVRPRGSSPQRRFVETILSLGGSRSDGVLVEGLAPGALRLVPAATGLVVEVSVAGARVAGHPVPAGGRRLLRPGEEVELRGVTLALAAPTQPSGEDGTRCAAAALLRGAVAGEVGMGAGLVVLSGPDAGARYPLGAEATLGRGRGATIRLADPRASRLHARVRSGPEGVTVEDLGSKNGVRLGGVRIEARRSYPLTPAQELSVGETLLALEAGARSGGPGAAPAPAAEGGRGPPAIALRLATAALLAGAATALALAGS